VFTCGERIVDAAAELVLYAGGSGHPPWCASRSMQRAAAGRTVPVSQSIPTAALLGLRRNVHAGESSGPEGVRDAIELLGVDRIDSRQCERFETPGWFGGWSIVRFPSASPTSIDARCHPASRRVHDRSPAPRLVAVSTSTPMIRYCWSPALCRRVRVFTCLLAVGLRPSVSGTQFDRSSFANADVKARLI